MKKKLPWFFSTFIAVFLLFLFVKGVFAQEVPITGTWVEDNQVTFAGKMAARARDFLDWSLQDYNWVYLGERGSTAGNPLLDFWVQLRNIVYAILTIFILAGAFLMIIRRGRDITIAKFIPRFIIVILLVTFSFAIIQFLYQITDVIQGFFLHVKDKITGKDVIISSTNLLHVAWDYASFIGFRKLGTSPEESIFITTLLTKITAITYYVMAGVLLLRKIILWFFLIVSPIFPLLLFFYPIRNTAKIWVGEFFRWLLYGPLFAIFLKGLVILWSQNLPVNIPMKFNYANPNQPYETSVNILLGGPGQNVNYQNALNSPDTFAQYVVALIMLWVVIILPFVLLHIFLDYLFSLQLGNYYPAIKQMVNNRFPFINGPPNVPSGLIVQPTPPPIMPSSTGMARAIPFAKQAIRSFDYSRFRQPQSLSNTRNIQNVSQILKMTNLSVPTMRDIARYETNLISRDATKRQEISNMRESLIKIANPVITQNTVERDRFVSIKNELLREKEKGNPLAASVLTAANTSITETSTQKQETSRQTEINSIKEVLIKIANPSMIVDRFDQEKYTELKSRLEKEKENTLSREILAAATETASKEKEATISTTDQEKYTELKSKLEKEKDNSLVTAVLEAAKDEEAKLKAIQKPKISKPLVAGALSQFPVVNRVQQVSFDDYEAVKKLWQENYHNLEVPRDIDGTQKPREQWIKDDANQITETINLLSSGIPQQVSQGMQNVSKILPFLLVGGFSQTEVIAYLKAKLEAGKSVLADLESKQEEEETTLSVEKKRVEIPKEMSAAMEIEEEKEKLPEVRNQEHESNEEGSKISE